MKHLFSAEGDAALTDIMARKPLLAFDFDGTLAPIVARPDAARVPTGVSRWLSQLARVLPLAIVSGRSVDDLRSRIAFQPQFVIGNHGAEDPMEAPGDANDWASVLDGLRLRLWEQASQLAAAGVDVEDKRFSIALHYRRAIDHDSALTLTTRVLSEVDARLSVFGGMMVANVVPAQAPDKAHAVARLVERAGVDCAVFVGDDINDEPVFARPEPSWLTVRVGHNYPNSQAKFFVDDAGEVETMLERMLAAVGNSAK